MTPSSVDAAPPATCTVHWVKPVEMELLVTVALHPLPAAETEGVLPGETVAVVLAASVDQSGA